jgi:methanogenic corrinoid protein MtbC1
MPPSSPIPHARNAAQTSQTAPAQPAAAPQTPSTRRASQAVTDALDDLRTRYLKAQLEGDRGTALRVVLEEGLGGGHHVEDLELLVIAAAQHEIGVLWQQNRISIADEHQATAISQTVLAHLYRHLPRAKPSQRRVVVACVEGEHHDMGGRIITDFLEMGGFDVRFLGANVPTDSLLDVLRRDRPAMVALTCALSFNLPALRATIVRVRQAFARSIFIAAGGQAFAFSAGVAANVGADYAGVDAKALVLEAKRALGVP